MLEITENLILDVFSAKFQKKILKKNSFAKKCPQPSKLQKCNK